MLCVFKSNLKGRAHVCLCVTESGRDKGSGMAVMLINLPPVNLIGHNHTSVHATMLLLTMNLRPLRQYTE